MVENQIDLLNETVLQLSHRKRKELLPWWIKIFMWIFLVFGAFVPIVIVSRIFGFHALLAIYSLQTNEPFSIAGFVVISIFAIKGVTSFGLLTEKDWAIKLGIGDALLGIFICIFSMVYPLIDSAGTSSFKIEILFLIPYLIKLLKIKSEWENFHEIV